MTIWPAASLLLALAASPAWAETATPSEPAAVQHDQPQGQQPRRGNDRNRAGTCANCTSRSVRAPITEAPNRGLMMIPAAHIQPARRGLPDWGDVGAIRSLALMTSAQRPPLPLYR